MTPKAKGERGKNETDREAKTDRERRERTEKERPELRGGKIEKR